MNNDKLLYRDKWCSDFLESIFDELRDYDIQSIIVSPSDAQLRIAFGGISLPREYNHVFGCSVAGVEITPSYVLAKVKELYVIRENVRLGKYQEV